jgi:chromosome segregation ATPase
VSLTERLESRQTQLDSANTEVIAIQAVLDLKLTEIEELRQKHSEEIDGLHGTHEQHRSDAVNEVEARIATLTGEFQQKEDLWHEAREDFETRIAQKAEEIVQVADEKEALKEDGLAKEERLRSALEEMRRTHDSLDADFERLRKTLQSLGEATDLKNTKGDTFL